MKIIVSEFVSLDGVMEAPGGEPGYPHSGWVIAHMSPEQLAYKLAEVLEVESLLIGRRLFPESKDKASLRLLDTRTFGSGVVVHSYCPASARN